MPPMPPMPPMSPPAAGASGSGLSATTASVVRKRPAMDAAFCSAERVTFTGSMMPAARRSSYTPVAALLYVLIVHLLFDVVVFLAIVHARHPGAIPIFLV